MSLMNILLFIIKVKSKWKIDILLKKFYSKFLIYVGYIDKMNFTVQKKNHFNKIIIPNEHNIRCIVLIDKVDTIVSFHIGFISSVSHTS
jgi:hypothetical protein